MDDVTRRNAMRVAAATGVGVAVLGAGDARAQDDATKGEDDYMTAKASDDEQRAFDAFKAGRAKGVGVDAKGFAPEAANLLRVTIPIPYALPLGAVNIAGVLYIADPLGNSYTDGAAIGAVNGTYHLDKTRTSVSLYDPTGALVKVQLELRFNEKRFVGRICTRTLTGWRCSGWKTLASW